VTGLLTRSTIVVVTWRGKDHVSACLDAVAAQTRPHRLLVIDNASDDGTAEVLAAHPTSPPVLRLPTNVGYAGALAAVAVDTEFTAWLNDDAMPAPDWLARLEDALDQRPDAAAAGSRMVGMDGSVISLGVALTADGHGVDLVSAGEPVFGFCGGAALLRTAVLQEVGGVPARFFCYYEDTDTAWRLRLAGHTIVSVPSAEVTHRHGASTRPGSRQFHLWNERNRLVMLIRCAPAGVAAREVLRFAAITALLPIRRVVEVARRPLEARWAAEGLRRLPGRFRRVPGGIRRVLGGVQPAAGAGHPVGNHPGVDQGDVDNPPLSRRSRRWSRVAWIRGPEASGVEPAEGSGSQPETRATQPQASVAVSRPDADQPLKRQPETPWNFRISLRLQVLREVAESLPVTLRERRTISRVTNVPRSMVWRRARSVNSVG
jgi:GT2 family glycosyltransferase